MRYQCPFCQKEHTDPDAFTVCVYTCRREEKRRERESAQKVLDETKKERWNEVCKAMRHADDLHQHFLSDYPSSPRRFKIERIPFHGGLTDILGIL